MQTQKNSQHYQKERQHPERPAFPMTETGQKHFELLKLMQPVR
eukprot:COSAG02_NODE_403_length_23058_cov_12.124134_10_plen_43_part_00